jgi:hypothetical protein
MPSTGWRPCWTSMVVQGHRFGHRSAGSSRIVRAASPASSTKPMAAASTRSSWSTVVEHAGPGMTDGTGIFHLVDAGSCARLCHWCSVTNPCDVNAPYVAHVRSSGPAGLRTGPVGEEIAAGHVGQRKRSADEGRRPCRPVPRAGYVVAMLYFLVFVTYSDVVDPVEHGERRSWRTTAACASSNLISYVVFGIDPGDSGPGASRTLRASSTCPVPGSDRRGVPLGSHARGERVDLQRRRGWRWIALHSTSSRAGVRGHRGQGDPRTVADGLGGSPAANCSVDCGYSSSA